MADDEDEEQSCKKNWPPHSKLVVTQLAIAFTGKDGDIKTKDFLSAISDSVQHAHCENGSESTKTTHIASTNAIPLAKNLHRVWKIRN